MLAAVHGFCEADLESLHELEVQHFSHVDEPKLRRVLAETLYGARWIYKLGLALLVRDEKQLAHVRMQVLDYGSVCEGLLSSMIHHAAVKGHLKKNKYKFNDTARLREPIDWSEPDKNKVLGKRSFHWIIEVAEEEGIIKPDLAIKLHDLRKERNTVHLRARTYQAFLGTSKRIYAVLRDTVEQTKVWRARHK